MTKTNFKKLVDQLQAITPMCNFEMPQVLCTDEELYFRRHHGWMNKEITLMTSLVSGSG